MRCKTFVPGPKWILVVCPEDAIVTCAGWNGGNERIPRRKECREWNSIEDR